MAGADYLDCEICNERTFYDGNVGYIDHDIGDMAIICKKCSNNFKIYIINKKTGKGRKRNFNQLKSRRIK